MSSHKKGVLSLFSRFTVYFLGFDFFSLVSAIILRGVTFHLRKELSLCIIHRKFTELGLKQNSNVLITALTLDCDYFSSGIIYMYIPKTMNGFEYLSGLHNFAMEVLFSKI